MFNKEDLDLIREKIDMLTFLEKSGVVFRQSGVSWIGLCPIHNERSPSFHVKPDSQTFRCFGCGISGDIFSLVQEMEGLSFPGAVQFLAEESGVELKVDDDPLFKHHQRLLQITRLSSEWFRWNYSQIPMNHPAKLDLEKRNLLEYSLSDESIGFAPSQGLISLLLKKGFTLEELSEAGVAILPHENQDNPRERFRNRLIWTVYDVQGHPIGFSARKIFDNDNGPKYINSPQTGLYNKSKTLLGLSTAKREISRLQEVFVVEGNADVMAMKAAGRMNTVASCGTAFGIEHANMLLHLSNLGKDANKFRIVFCFDADAAGVKAAKNVFHKNKNIQVNSYVVKLSNPDGSATDPCDYRKDNGNEGLFQVSGQDNQISLVEFVLSEARNEWDLKTPEGQSGYVNEAKQILDHISDPIQYSSYLRKVASWTGISFSQITRIMRQNVTYASDKQEDIVKKADLKGDPFENQILAAFVQYPQKSVDLMVKYNIDLSFFPTCKELALTVIDQADEGSFDYANRDISFLTHIDLGIIKGREDFGLNLLFNNYLRHLYANEVNELNSLLTNSSPEAFKILVEKQTKLKIKYHM